MGQCKTALVIGCSAQPDSEFWDSLVSFLHNGIAIEVYLNSEWASTLRNSLFENNKLSLLGKKGACFYSIPSSLLTGDVLCLDYNTLLSFKNKGQMLSKDRVALLRFYETLVEWRKNAKNYHSDGTDIQMEVHVSPCFYTTKDAIALQWKVQNAEKVVVSGLGEVEAEGEKLVHLTSSEIIKFGAYNAHQSKMQSRAAFYIESLPIAYKISIDESKSSQLFPFEGDVYAAQENAKLTFTWDIPIMESVSINPFNLTDLKGSFGFTLDTAKEIIIEGVYEGRLYRKYILVLAYPAALLNKAKAPELQLPDFDHLSSEIQPLQQEALLAIRKNIEEKNKELLSRMQDSKFDLSNNYFNLPIANPPNARKKTAFGWLEKIAKIFK